MNFIIVTAFLITLTWARPQQFDQQLFPVKQFPTQQFPVRQFPNQQFPVQQFPGNPFLTGNNENHNQGNNNGNNFVTSTTNAPTTVTTASPQYLACLQSCPSTMEYNPICGSDNENYHNNGRLNCAQRCGKGLLVCTIQAYPDSRNPNLEYEIINPKELPKRELEPITTTTRSIVINTPPPPPANSKTFAYDPLSKSWSQVKKHDPQPSEDTLLWNQSNDKWLTMVARI